MAQQTAIQELIEDLDIEFKERGISVNWEIYLEQEKEDIEDAFQAGKWNGYEYANGVSEIKDPAEYYKETYGKE